MDYLIKDITLSIDGLKKIEWANKNMQVLNIIREREI